MNYWITLFLFRYISGSMHYSRVPSALWRDRLEKFYAAGLNAVQTYVPWNFHETFSGIYDFEGDHNLTKFILTAQEVGLVVVLRAGPYIDAEWEMGGFPFWLLKDKSIALRTSDPVYLTYVDRWYSVLLPKMKPLLYDNGGPIITVQVENEYGSYYACDRNYMQHLEKTFRQHLGSNAVLFTTDGASSSDLKCGSLVPLLYATVDFGITADPAQRFQIQRDYEPHGPLVNSEFYTGWLDWWGYPHQTRNATQVAQTLDAILKLNASVNMYMFEGGTNFGFWSGSDPPQGKFAAVPTSYDYDAPLTEAGDPWEKFTLIREVISKYKPVPSHVPGPAPKGAYGKVQMAEYAWLFNSPDLVTKTVSAEDPVCMEDMDQPFGFIIYTATHTSFPHIAKPTKSDLLLAGLHDRALVFVDKQFQGIAMRTTVLKTNVSLNITLPSSDATVDIIVENMGRICFQTYINDSKGILHGVELDGKPWKEWVSKSVPLNDTNKIAFQSLNQSSQPDSSVVFFRGLFSIDGQPCDTYLNVTGWTKGQAFVNGFNLGRYWPTVGPQKTLYVPATILKSGTDANELILFEIDRAPCIPPFSHCYATLVNTADIG